MLKVLDGSTAASTKAKKLAYIISLTGTLTDKHP